jgi:hypothetical protein
MKQVHRSCLDRECASFVALVGLAMASTILAPAVDRRVAGLAAHEVLKTAHVIYPVRAGNIKLNPSRFTHQLTRHLPALHGLILGVTYTRTRYLLKDTPIPGPPLLNLHHVNSHMPLPRLSVVHGPHLCY